MKCLYNGDEFIQNRANQKFANSKNRMRYHNDKIKKLKKAMSPIDNKQFKNYNILLKLMQDTEEANFHKEFLLGKGFAFDVLTHYVFFKGKNRHAIYDFIIYEKEDRIYFIKY